jgi:hypothetical protein
MKETKTGFNTRGKHALPLSDAEKQLIRESFKKVPIRELSKKMQRGAKTIYDFVKADGFAEVDGSKDTRNHPWRKANHQLEIYKKQYEH